MFKYLKLVICCFALLATSVAGAGIFPGVPADSVDPPQLVQTEDGVDLVLYHLVNKDRPIILLMPGLGAQGLSLEGPAQNLFNRAKLDTFVGNWRGSVELEKGKTLLVDNNDLEAIVRKDFPALLRAVIKQASPEQLRYGITLLGHSMGGMMINGTLTDPALRAEFAPYIRGIVLFQSPHNVAHVGTHLKWFARAAVPLLDYLNNRGVEGVDYHSKILASAYESKQKGGVQGRFITPAAENAAMFLAKLAINPAHTGRKAWRRAFFRMPAFSIPVDLLRSFANSVLNGGEFLDSRGRLLIDPSQLTDLPYLVVRTKLDTLAPWEEQGDYFNAIASRNKLLLSIHEMNHVDPILFTDPAVDFLDYVVRFIEDPLRTTMGGGEVRFEPNCEGLLGRLRLRFRLLNGV